MTLGRALQEIGEAGDARAEFTYVLSLAPDNLAAIRGLAELHGDDEDAGVPVAPPPSVAAPDAAPVPVSPAEPESAPEPDFAALDASMGQANASSSAAAEREAQIERLEIWLARIEQARGG